MLLIEEHDVRGPVVENVRQSDVELTWNADVELN